MKITRIELVRYSRGIRVHAGPIDWLWVRIHTDEGLSGLGETYPCSAAEAAVIRHSLAPVMLGRSPLDRERLWADMLLAVSYHGWAGAEMRAISAIDIALWDIAGKVANQPVYMLLGGATRAAIPIYNTCYDHIDFNTEPERLAEELLASGVEAMKIWPFDGLAIRNRGQNLTSAELREAAAPLERIRKRVGDRMAVAMEFHGYWNLPSAIRIARALEPLEPMWLEEMLPQDNLASYRELAVSTRLPLTLSERLMTRWGFRELMENQAARIVMPDICWCGGISEARKIAEMAETWYLPVAPHNCGGPVLHLASAHLAASVTNLFILETVRRHYLDEYRGLLTADLIPSGGKLPLPGGPGLGADLDSGVLTRGNVTVETLEL
ncbi:MAG: mandelate racemase/muconate lactonizing enzyme family protein [Bryobacteraceae bacterium]